MSTPLAVRELFDSSEYWKLSLEAAELGTWYHDVESDTAEMDQRARVIFGLPAIGPVSPEEVRSGVYPADRERVLEAFEHAASPGSDGVYRVERRTRLPDGSVRWVAIRGQVYFEGMGDQRRPARVVGVVMDVTLQKEREEELKRAKALAEEMSRLKTAFLANISHEIRTPLTGLLLTADMLAQHLAGADRQAAARLSAGAQQLAHVVDDILVVSQLEAGTTEIQVEDVDVKCLVDDVAASFAPGAARKSLQLKILTEPCSAHADLSALRSVLSHILDNAVKFTDQGSITVSAKKVEGAYGEGPRVRIDVTDTGPGVSAEFLPGLFDPFTQESTGTTRTHGGSGLGLAIAKGLTDLMGGSVGVRSTSGKGATFTVMLPAVP